MNTNYFFISFKEASHICDKSQYNEASLWNKLKLNIRLLWCKQTRKYVAENKKLTSIIQEANLQTLTKKEKEELETYLKNTKNYFV